MTRLNGRAPRVEASAPAAPSIIGRWKDASGTDLVEFRADGSLSEQSATGEQIQGRYSLAGDQLIVQIDGADRLSFSISVARETLELRHPDGQASHYVRAK